MNPPHHLHLYPPISLHGRLWNDAGGSVNHLRSCDNSLLQLSIFFPLHQYPYWSDCKTWATPPKVLPPNRQVNAIAGQAVSFLKLSVYKLDKKSSQATRPPLVL